MLLCACGAPPAAKSSAKVRVVTTIGILADWARQVGGDRVEVTSFLTGNESPHTYEASPRDAEKLASADILFRVGLGMEEWLDPVVRNAGRKELVVVDASAGVTDVIAGDEHDKYGNPHIWLDPELAKNGIGNLVNALVSADPTGETLYRRRQQVYFTRIDSLAEVIRSGVAALADRRFISFHDAWPYFARRFGLEVVATIEPIPGQEPSARELARLVDLIRRERIKVVTAEPQLSSSLPEMLARETGVKVLVLDPLESGGGYLAALGGSAELLIGALKQ